MTPQRIETWTLTWSLVALALIGCAATPEPATAAAATTPAKAHPTVEVATVVVSPYSETELVAQFDAAKARLLAEKYPDAADMFDRLVRLAPDGVTAAPSLYNGGLAHEALGDREGAVEHYREQLRRFPDAETSRSALVRTTRLLAYLERWPDLAETAATLSKRTDVSVLEKVEALGHSALGLAEQDKIEEATKLTLAARDLVEENHLGESGKPPIEMAPVAFALGELRKRQSERIVFEPVPSNFGDVLEQRCQGLLDAQNAYMDAMRSLDAHWSAMAGYRVGQMYQQLHRDVMRVPAPGRADTLKKKQLFEGAMRLRYRVLLEKGLKMMDATVRLGERTGELSAWVGRARDAKRDLELAMESERAAMGKLPFTEQELQAALDSLKKP